MTSPRKNIMLGTAGHVDHGKTSLVKLLTGCDTDRLPAEKQRGMTIELGFAPCRMRDQRIVGVVDVPGHVDFIRNMVAGAQGVDVVMLVVAADDGVMPQTREHLHILTLMGVRGGLVALTKIDLVDGPMRELAIEDVRRATAGTFLEGKPIRPVSNITGEGFDGFFEALNAEVESCRPREISGLFRLWIERGFLAHGFGAVVSGIPSAGEVRVGDRLTLVPGGQVARVRRLEVYGEQSEVGRAGECVAVNLTDVEPEKLVRGAVLCEGDAFAAVEMFEAELRLLPAVPQALADYTEVHVHVGTAEVMAHVAMLEGRPIEPGGAGLVQLRLAGAAPVAAGERFVIRGSVAGLAGGRVTTIGGGRVLGTSGVRLRRNRPWTIALLDARRKALDSPSAWCAAVLKESAGPATVDALARAAGLRASTVEALLKDLRSRSLVADLPGGAVAHRDVLNELAAKVTEALEKFHQANPMRQGLEQAELLAGLKCDRTLLDSAIAKLAGEGRLQRRGLVLGLSGRGAQVSAEDQRLCRQVEDEYRHAHLAAPSPAELAAKLSLPPARLEKMLRLLADGGAVVRLDEKVLLHRQAVEAAQQVALDLFAGQGSFTTMQYRDRLGASRKYAVPLLDYFDTIHWTVRSGNRRTPGSEAKKRLSAS